METKTDKDKLIANFTKQKEKIEEPDEFLELVANLEGDLGEHIIKSINFDEIF